MNRLFYISILFLFPGACLTTASCQPAGTGFNVKIQNLNLSDASRNRSVPVALYQPETDKKIKNQQIIIFSHGYGENKGGDNLIYSYLNEKLASEGYFVASIQHELGTDSLLPMTGIPQITRRTNWERGTVNILFVLNELKKSNPDLDFKHLTLIGHSNGGDMTALFAHKYPGLAYKIITLDNRRKALSGIRKTKVYSIRSSDQPADEGVLPNPEEVKKYKMKIIRLSNTRHNEMDDDANEMQRKEINDYVLTFLRD